MDGFENLVGSCNKNGLTIYIKIGEENHEDMFYIKYLHSLFILLKNEDFIKIYVSFHFFEKILCIYLFIIHYLLI